MWVQPVRAQKGTRPMVDYRVDRAGIAIEDGMTQPKKLGCGMLGRESKGFLQSFQIQVRADESMGFL